MKITVLVFMLLLANTLHGQEKYEPTWESIDARPTPQWFTDAKFGIFIHWGVYSVPAYREPVEDNDWHGVYAEWYGPDVMYKPWRNDSFHVRNYGKDFEYRDFAGLFKAELWDPGFWAKTFKDAGAKYMVLTTKHSDGYCLWPTKDPVSKDWNAGDTGPKRDLVKDLTGAVRKQGMKMGFYYSWLEYESIKTDWPHQEKLADERTGYYVPKKIYDKYHIPHKQYIEHCHFQFKELINNYEPDLIWADATWDHSADWWQSKDIVAWMLNNAPNKDELVINDRWDNTEKKHGGYVTTEYGTGASGIEEGRPWEECQGIGYSFGYNRAENLDQYKTAGELIHLLVRTVANGGNLLLNIGPRADGTIPVIMQERLKQMGEWLEIYGEAIYKTRPFDEDNRPAVKAIDNVYFTQRDSTGYLIFMQWPESVQNLFFTFKHETPLKRIDLMGFENNLSFVSDNRAVKVNLPTVSPDEAEEAYVLKMVWPK